MGKIILYGSNGSPPVRAVLLTLNALNLPHELKEVNTLLGEHKTPEYLAKNPQGTVPMLEDDGVYLADSHAMNAYLVRKYGKDDSLYPRDYLQRAIVDERLYYEASAVFVGALRPLTSELLYQKLGRLQQVRIDNIDKVFATLEDILKEHNYVAGDQLTIADFNFVSTVTSLTSVHEVDPNKYPKVSAWLKRLQQLPYYEVANGIGLKKLVDAIKATNYKIIP